MVMATAGAWKLVDHRVEAIAKRTMIRCATELTLNNTLEHNPPIRAPRDPYAKLSMETSLPSAATSRSTITPTQERVAPLIYIKLVMLGISTPKKSPKVNQNVIGLLIMGGLAFALLSPKLNLSKRLWTLSNLRRLGPSTSMPMKQLLMV